MLSPFFAAIPIWASSQQLWVFAPCSLSHCCFPQAIVEFVALPYKLAALTTCQGLLAGSPSVLVLLLSTNLQPPEICCHLHHLKCPGPGLSACAVLHLCCTSCGWFSPAKAMPIVGTADQRPGDSRLSPCTWALRHPLDLSTDPGQGDDSHDPPYQSPLSSLEHFLPTISPNAQ